MFANLANRLFWEPSSSRGTFAGWCFCCDYVSRPILLPGLRHDTKGRAARVHGHEQTNGVAPTTESLSSLFFMSDRSTWSHTPEPGATKDKHIIQAV